MTRLLSGHGPILAILGPTAQDAVHRTDTGLALRTLIEGYPKYEIPAKLAKCCELTRILTKQGKKVVIGSTFVHNPEMLARQLANLCPLVVHGGVPYAVSDEDKLSREKIITRFKTDRDCPILIANPAACGESISLHLACHDAIYLDRSFNCAHYMQSLDRIHRLGLAPDDVVSYYIMESRETIDQIVRQRLSEKMKNMRRVLEAPLPGRIAGFWDEEPDGVEDLDLDLVERHIRSAASRQ
jgi:SNF2 family DNA or RNA helicase